MTRTKKVSLIEPEWTRAPLIEPEWRDDAPLIEPEWRVGRFVVAEFGSGDPLLESLW